MVCGCCQRELQRRQTLDDGDIPRGYLAVRFGEQTFSEGKRNLEVRLTWQGEAAVGVQIAMFHLPSGGASPGDTIRTVRRTGPDRYARLSMLGAGQYLLSAVRIEPVDGPGSVVWQSHWASLAFEVMGME